MRRAFPLGLIVSVLLLALSVIAPIVTWPRHAHTITGTIESLVMNKGHSEARARYGHVTICGVPYFVDVDAITVPDVGTPVTATVAHATFFGEVLVSVQPTK